jgi:acetate kinase
MRALRASSDPAAKEAVALFVYRIVREIGSLVAALGGIDGLVFSAGICECRPTSVACIAPCGSIEIDRLSRLTAKRLCFD